MIRVKYNCPNSPVKFRTENFNTANEAINWVRNYQRDFGTSWHIEIEIVSSPMSFDVFCNNCTCGDNGKPGPTHGLGCSLYAIFGGGK